MSDVDTATRHLLALSQWVDAHNAHRDTEAQAWSRISKASEEAGEATTAWRGVVGENPRKGVTHTRDDVIEELLDTAVASIGAVEHLLGHKGVVFALLFDKIDRVHARAFPGGPR